MASSSPPITTLHNIVFGIGSSATTWSSRVDFIRAWWKPSEMRGYVWLDKPLENFSQVDYLPSWRISENVSHFEYTNPDGDPSAIRISRIVSESFRLDLPDVHWFVMGDDDTVFFAENLVKVLSQYDHRKWYYIGYVSESHLQNMWHSSNMAYGGGGFAISYPLAAALARIQDSCLSRYPYLFGSDIRIYACLAELGVPLIKEAGFHQMDMHGDPFGFLTAHPLRPLVSLHHLESIQPIFPDKTQIHGIHHLLKAAKADSEGILQQSICYDKNTGWSLSISWGYAVQIFRGFHAAMELEKATRTFSGWNSLTNDAQFLFNTRAASDNPCEKPVIFYFQHVEHHTPDSGSLNPEKTVSLYGRQNHSISNSEACHWRVKSPLKMKTVKVIKERVDELWLQAPRRQCCRVRSLRRRQVEVEVQNCREDDVIAGVWKQVRKAKS